MKNIYNNLWKFKSAKWKEDSDCEYCGSMANLTCHHRTYETAGFERREDVRVLCWDCHKKYHRRNGEYVKKVRKGISSKDSKKIAHMKINHSLTERDLKYIRGVNNKNWKKRLKNA